MCTKDGWFWVGISEYTMCLNDDYTIGLKNVKTNSETIETEPVPNDNVFAFPGLIIQMLEKNGAEHTDFPLASTFCTPALHSFYKEQHSSGIHKLSIIKSKQFIEWFGNERKYKFRWVLWEFCRSPLSYDFFLRESTQNTYTSRSYYDSRRYSPDFINIQLKPSVSGSS